ncbi:MAG: helix-turn-helix domain-containing protein [Alphaproteobacteria bacterium]|nr:helix-turn-helix domain-containing protein [Alphaproteobacteria bacterium]
MEKADLPDWKLAYRLDEAAAATGIGRSTLYRRARQGKLKMKRDGGNTVILREELKRFLSELPDAEIRQGESH